MFCVEESLKNIQLETFTATGSDKVSSQAAVSI